MFQKWSMKINAKMLIFSVYVTHVIFFSSLSVRRASNNKVVYISKTRSTITGQKCFPEMKRTSSQELLGINRTAIYFSWNICIVFKRYASTGWTSFFIGNHISREEGKRKYSRFNYRHAIYVCNGGLTPYLYVCIFLNSLTYSLVKTEL